jgi:hypothetical protein
VVLTPIWQLARSIVARATSAGSTQWGISNERPGRRTSNAPPEGKRQDSESAMARWREAPSLAQGLRRIQESRSVSPAYAFDARQPQRA